MVHNDGRHRGDRARPRATAPASLEHPHQVSLDSSTHLRPPQKAATVVGRRLRLELV